MTWQTKNLGDVCKVIAGQSPEGIFYNKLGKGLPFYQGKKDFGEKFIEEPTVWTTHVTKEAEEGDILMSVRAPVGPTNFATQRICIGRGLAAIRPGAEINIFFLFYFFEMFKDQLIGNSGTVFNSINKTQIENIKIPLPAILEQKRIVKILDEAFEKLDIAKKNTEKNLQNSRELFESYLQTTFSNNSKWEEMRLGDVYDVRDGTHDSPRYQKEGYALITSKNLKKDKLDYRRIQYISERDYKKINERSKVNKGDILFAMIGTIGNPVVIKTEPDFAIKNVALFKVPKEQDSYFLKYFLDSRFVMDKMMSEAKGATQKFVGLGYLRDFKIKVPPLQEQKQIVKKIDQLSEKTQKLESLYQQKLENIEELKKSILNKAFSGEI